MTTVGRRFVLSKRLVLALLACALVSGFLSATQARGEVGNYLLSRQDIDKLGRHIEANPDRFSGFWFDHPSGRFVLAVPGQVDSVQALKEIAELIPQRPAVADAAPVEVVHREHSLKQLRNAFEEIRGVLSKLEPSSRGLNTWYVDERTSTVTIGAASTLEQNWAEVARDLRW